MVLWARQARGISTVTHTDVHVTSRVPPATGIDVAAEEHHKYGIVLPPIWPIMLLFVVEHADCIDKAGVGFPEGVGRRHSISCM